MKLESMVQQGRRLFSAFRNFLTGNRVPPRIRIVAGLALLTLCTVASLQCNPRIARTKVPGLVLEIDALGIQADESGLPHCRVLLAVGDSSQTRILLPPPVPLPGHFIPLVATQYKKGNIEYALDQEKWLEEGPS